MAPYWVSYPAQVELAGGKVVAVTTHPKDGFVPELDAIRDAITAKT
jgi:aspartate aminotransferase